MHKQILLVIPVFLFFVPAQAQNIMDDFEGNGNITTWFGDNCGINTSFTNPVQTGINTSSKVLRYADVGGQYANVRFDATANFNMNSFYIFSLKIYVPSSGITGTQPNQISLKLQNNTLGAPWSTQCEIIKPIVLNQWQVVTFNFSTDPYFNLNASSGPPSLRTDFNRVVLQVNGENNNAQVLAYIDDFFYNTTVSNPVFNQLVWSDEFDTSGAVRPSRWFHQTQLPAGGSWYNGEIQHYTNRLVNSSVSSGTLKIVAKKETFSDQGVTKQYTSARLNSKFAFTYGRVEVRAKLPTGNGTWPAIWMLGKNIIEPGGYWSATNGTVNWPACGEIDIMEHWGTNQNYVQSAMHTPSSSGSTVNLGGQSVSTASTQFHIYAMEWTSEKIVFSVDGVVHYTYNPPVKNASTWPFDQPQYLLLNVAMLPSVSATFTQSTMEIDYVRVYQTNTTLTPKQVNLNLFIEGYYTVNSTMAPVKNNQESPVVSPPDEVEDILVELHSSTAPYAKVDSAIAILKTNGSAACTFNNTAPGSYYIVVKSRNALETWSPTPQLVGTTALNYNFSNAAGKAYGNNMKQMQPNVWALFSGELNDDGNIDLLDLAILQADILSFQNGDVDTDLNGDGNVDLLDSSIIAVNIDNFIYSMHP